MGAWGTESYSNDSVWDALARSHKDPRRIGQANVSATVINVFRSERDGDETKLGVVVFFLLRGMKIPRRYLEEALRIAKRLAGAKKYLRNWVEPKVRKEALLWEAGQMEWALKHGCQGRKAQYVDDILASFGKGGR
jgi:hypothetical protein